MRRRCKSIGKEVSRGFEDEVKDYAFQPLKSLNLFDELVKRITNKAPPIEVSDGLKNNSGGPKKYLWRHCLSTEQISLVQQCSEKSSYFNSEMIKDFAEGLRGDSLECYEHMYDVRHLFNKQVLSHYQEIHKELKTIPLLFLSVVKTQKKGISAIYLWQFNEWCPIEHKPTKMAVDCPFKHHQVFVPHNSILLLAKFATTDKEELLDGQFLSDSRIVIKSKVSGGSHVRFREYDMMDLLDIVSVNPFEARSDNNKFHCASKLDVSLDEGEKVINCDLSRIRRLKEIELLEFAGVDTVSMFIKTDSQQIAVNSDILPENLFSEIYYDKESSFIVLVDRILSKVILFKKDSLKVIDSSDIGGIHSIFQDAYVLYFLSKEGKVFKITPSLCNSEKCYQDLDVKIPVDEAQKIRFVKNEDVQYLVYLIGSKFYAMMLEVKGTSEYLFDVEDLEKGEHLTDKPQAKFNWEIVEDKIVMIKGIYVHVYDLTEQRFTKRELQSTELLEYEWELLAEKNRLFGLSFSKYEEHWRIKAIALKENEIQQSEKMFKISNDFSNYLIAELKKTEESVYVKLTGPHNDIVFLRLEEPYLADNVNRVVNMPNYLFSNFIFPAKRNVPKQVNTWQDYYRRQEKEAEQKRKEEFKKQIEKEEQEFEEFIEMKTKVETFMKKPEKKNEERKEKMQELRKAIAKSANEEGADKNDKRLKDVKEEYMSMYQDIKKEKKKQTKEKEKDKMKDRKNARSNKNDY